MFQGFLAKILDCKNAFVISSIAMCNIIIIIVMHGIKCEFLYQFWTFLHHFCTSDFCSPACFCERFEPRSHFLSRLSMILCVNVVLNRTVVVVDSDWRFDNLSSSHLQSQSELYHES